MDNKIHNIVERITGALFLIFIGCIFLLNTTGALPWSVWSNVFMTFFRIWPIFLIFAGIQIILSGNKIAKSVFDVLWTILIIGIFSLAILTSTGRIDLPTWLNDMGWNFSFTDVNTVTQQQKIETKDFKDVTALEYNFNIQAGDFQISSVKDSSAYLYTHAKFKENTGKPLTVSEQTEGNLKIDFSQEFKGFNFGTSRLDYNFLVDSNNLPTDLNIEMTAGDLKSNFKELALNKLSLVVTAGNAEIMVNEELVEANIKVTAGKLNLTVPKNVKLEINANSTAGDIKVDSQKISSGKTVINPSGEKTIQLDLAQTAGDIEIERE